jgi:hypothetical protein
MFICAQTKYKAIVVNVFSQYPENGAPGRPKNIKYICLATNTVNHTDLKLVPNCLPPYLALLETVLTINVKRKKC